MDLLEELYKTGKTVFSLQDMRALWREPRADALRAKAKYYAREGRLFRLKRGIYALTKEYDPFELAQILITPSYISGDSALRYHGLLFQYSVTITCIAGYTRTLHVGERIYRYHKIRRDILSAPIGIEGEKHYMMALPERAFCDSVYLGYAPSVEDSYRWDKDLLRKLMALYDVPRVSLALSSLLS